MSPPITKLPQRCGLLSVISQHLAPLPIIPQRPVEGASLHSNTCGDTCRKCTTLNRTPSLRKRTSMERWMIHIWQRCARSGHRAPHLISAQLAIAMLFSTKESFFGAMST